MISRRHRRSRLSRSLVSRGDEQRFWMMAGLTVLSLVVAVWSSCVTHQALTFTRTIRAEDDARTAAESSRFRRDALLRMKLRLYGDYSRGSMQTLRTLTDGLALCVDPQSVLSDRRNRSLFMSYLYDAQIGPAVAEYCVRNMHGPTSDDLKLRYDLENEYLRLENDQFEVLELLGIAARSMADSVRRRVSRSVELSSDYVSVQPLPSTALATPLAASLLDADKHQGQGLVRQQLGRGAPGWGVRFFGPDGDPITPSTHYSSGSSRYLGMLRCGVASTVDAYNFYLEPVGRKER